MPCSLLTSESSLSPSPPVASAEAAPEVLDAEEENSKKVEIYPQIGKQQNVIVIKQSTE